MVVLRDRVAAEPLALRAGLGRAMTGLGAAGIAAAVRVDAEIVLAEVLNNIAEHAYGGRGGAIALALVLRHGGGLVLIVTDAGAPMPAGLHARAPRRAAGEAPARAGADLAEGGYGLALIAALAPQVRYRRIGGRNWLRLVLLPTQSPTESPNESPADIPAEMPAKTPAASIA